MTSRPGFGPLLWMISSICRRRTSRETVAATVLNLLDDRHAAKLRIRGCSSMVHHSLGVMQEIECHPLGVD